MASLEWCPFGCGQRSNEHMNGIPCPPQNAQGQWKNSPSVALGSKPQLKQDLKELSALQHSLDCTQCRLVLGRRMRVIEQRVAQMP